MKCASCNTPLNGSTVCPSCGALNMAFGAAPVAQAPVQQELPAIEGIPAVSNGPVIEDGPVAEVQPNNGIVIGDGEDIISTQSSGIVIEDEPEILEIPDEDETPIVGGTIQDGPVEYIQTPMPSAQVVTPQPQVIPTGCS